MAETVQIDVGEGAQEGAGGAGGASETEPRVEIALGADGEPGGGASDADEALLREAEALGWKPKDVYKGDPKKWKPAAEFLDFHNSIMPVVRAENRTLKQQNQELSTRIAHLEAKERERTERSEQVSVEALKYERKQAMELQDWGKVQEIDDKLIPAQVAQAQKPKNGAQPQIDPEVNRRATEIWNDFVADNEWAKDSRMQRAITIEAMNLQRADPSLYGRELLEEAKDKIRRLYPERFQSNRARPTAMTETSGANGASRTTTRTWSDLKPDAREALEPLLKEKGMTKEGILKRCAQNPQQYFTH